MTLPPLSGYSPPVDPPVSLEKLAEALQVLLSPEPLLSFLPTTLEYFSTFQRLAEVIHHQAGAALDADEALVVRLESSGVQDDELDQHGVLTEDEVDRLRELGDMRLEHHYSSEMMELSIKLRLYHTAALLSSPVTIPQARGITAQYFVQELPKASDGSVSHRYMKSERYDHYKKMNEEARDIIEQWYERTEAALKASKKRPTVESMMRTLEPEYQSDYPVKLAESVMATIHSVVQEVEELQQMFPDIPDEPEVEVDETGQDFTMEDLLPDDGSDPIDDAGPPAPQVQIHSKSSPIKRIAPEASPRSAKRPRPSSSAAPDYTAPAEKMGSRVDKSSLKPFDQSKFRRLSKPKFSSQVKQQNGAAPSGTQEKPIEL